MNKTEAASKIEYLETSEELLSKGLRKIKRRHRTKPGEMTLKDCKVITEVQIDADLYNFLKAKAENEGETSIEKFLNEILREKFEKEEAGKLAEIRELRSKLLNDKSFLQELKEKLAA